MKILDALGYLTTQFFVNSVELVIFIVTVLRRGFAYIFKNKRNLLIKNMIVREVIFDGIDSLFPTVLLLSVIIGFGITAQIITVLQSLGAETEVVNMLLHFVAFELSPLITAIIIICRGGSASAIVFGNMSINQEVKGLELLGIDALVYFAFPTLIGKAISATSLSVYFATLSVTLGIFFAAIFDSPADLKYFSILADSIAPLELLYFLIKNLFFGLIIGANSSFHGL